MANSQYEGKPFIYNSRGLDARHAPDRVPEGYYINFLNMFEREESAVSSRYGTQIINRDAAGVGTNNYFFSAPVTSLARFLYQGSAWRYAGTGDGNLWRIAGNGQGAFTGIFTGLSGNPFQSLITNCYETSQPYLFIYDQALSIKDSPGFISAPQLTGIDPPPYQVNALPFAPLLTLIDNFSASNSYATSGFDGGTPWAYASVASIPAGSPTIITDFPQFAVATTPNTITGSYEDISTSGTPPTVTGSCSASGFPSVAITPGLTVTMTVAMEQLYGDTGIKSGNGTNVFEYSTDGGSTWTPFFSQTFTTPTSGYPTAIDNTVVVTVPGLTNLDLLQVRGLSTLNHVIGTGTLNLGIGILSVVAVINEAGVFGHVCNGILSVLNSNSTISVPIVSASNAFDAGLLYVTTAKPHGLSAGNSIGLYGTSNPLIDGYYNVGGVTASNQFWVGLLSESLYQENSVSATGGFVMGGASAPSTAVLTDEYSTPYPAQFSAWGFYQEVPASETAFPVGCWSGKVDTNSTANVGVTANFDLSINNQVNDNDLIVLAIQIGAPANIVSIQLQFDVNGSGYTSSYYTSTISPAYYQGALVDQLSAYNATQNQILADALGLLSGQSVGSTTAQLQPSNFSTGAGAWVAVYIPRGNFLPVGNAGESGLDWTNITGWKLVIQTAATAVAGDGSSTVAVNGIYLQWGYGPSSFAGTGYDWRYTYYNANTGTESSPSPICQFNQQYGYLASLSAPFYFRQASQVQCVYSNDMQVTHVRLYRRGGLYASNWLLTQQVPNAFFLPNGGYNPVTIKDVVPDASLAQAQPLALDNDPPVTSSLVNPIQTTLAAATSGPGQSIYSTFGPQLITVTDNTAVFVPEQTVLVGNAYNLEEVMVVTGGTGQFSAVLRLQHNAGEQVSATSIPRVKCNLCALAYGLVWLAGDPNNPHYLYRSKPGYPENFSPAAYMPVSSPDDPIMAVINWRGTLIVATLKTWYIVANGSTVPQPTGAAHGLVATGGWCLVEGAVYFRSADGWRIFEGADGVYTTLPVEWIFRNSPPTIVPKADPTQSASDVFCFYQNQVYGSYISASNGPRYRLRFDNEYKRFGLDDVPATAMLWERDINSLLVGKQVGAGQYAVVQDWIGDYDDGGWSSGSLVQTPVNLDIWTPFHDLGKPHNPKQWNVLEGDYNTQGQQIQTTLYFKGEQDFSLAMPAQTTTGRSKVQYQIPPSGASNAQGIEAYSMSIRHQMAVTTAPILFQENVYAVLLADERTSWDCYWQKFDGDYLGILPKNLYIDYSGDTQLTVQIFADGSDTPYYIDDFTLIPQANRSVVRVQLPARKGRLWRVVITASTPFQLWSQVRVESKPLLEGSGYQQIPFEVYQ